MATGIVNPYAVASENTAYRDAVLADNPLSLWMMDEPYGDNVATDQGTSPSDGTYTGGLATSSTQRGSRTIFGLDAIGNATTGVVGGYVNCPMNTTVRNALSRTYANFDMTFEWIANFDSLTSGESTLFYDWIPWKFVTTTTNRFDFRFYSYSQGLTFLYQVNSYMVPGTDYHNVLTINGGASNVYWEWYVNGVRKATQTTGTGFAGMTSPYTVGTSFNAGGNSTSASTVGFYGGLAGVAIYDYYLGAANITAHYNALL